MSIRQSDTARVLLGAVLGAVAVGSLLVACGQQPDVVEQLPPQPRAAPAPAPVEPWSIAIPAIGVAQVLEPIGLTPERELDVPPASEPGVAAWYAGADPVTPGDECMPGSRCSAVVVGHVDGTGPDGERGFPGVFADLADLRSGHEVFVEQADGGSLRFVVESVESVDKDELPRDIYTLDDQPRLTLVTCGGSFDRASGHYRDNVLVRTVLAQ